MTLSAHKITDKGRGSIICAAPYPYYPTNLLSPAAGGWFQFGHGKCSDDCRFAKAIELVSNSALIRIEKLKISRLFWKELKII